MKNTPCGSLIEIDQQTLATDVSVDAVPDGNTGNGGTRLQALLHDLGFERFWIRASLAHGNPGDKGNRVREKIDGHHRP